MINKIFFTLLLLLALSVNSYSAGCQVFKNASDFKDFMKLVNKSADKFGNSFTYTLINEGDITT